MDAKFITLNRDNIGKEHVCCAFSDKKSTEGYELKKEWLKSGFDAGLVFCRLDARAKVFIEYMPAETAWVPVEAEGYLYIGCFWVAGQYKGQGYGKVLLQMAVEDAMQQGKNGLMTIAGTKKLSYLSDTKWLVRQGFEICQTLPYGYSLLVKKLNSEAKNPQFKETVMTGKCPETNGLVAYYTNRCPYTEWYVNVVLKGSALERGIPLKIIKLETCEQAQLSPTPATIFSLFLNGQYMTNDISCCIGDRLDKILK